MGNKMFEYELDVNFEVVNKGHLVSCSKDRTRLFIEEPEFIITENTGKTLLDWSNSGADTSIDEALFQVRNATSQEEITNIYHTFLPLIGKHEDFIQALKVKKEELTTK